MKREAELPSFILHPSAFILALAPARSRSRSCTRPAPRRPPFLLRADLLWLRAQGLFDGGAQLVGLDAPLVCEDDLAGAVVQEAAINLAAPGGVNEVDGRLLGGGVQEVGGQRRGARLGEELRHGLRDVRRVVERDDDEVEAVGRVLRLDPQEVWELLAARLAPGRPEVDEQRAVARRARAEQRLQPVLLDLLHLDLARVGGLGRGRLRLPLRLRYAFARGGTPLARARAARHARERGGERADGDQNLSHVRLGSG